jgi:uncharacterized membrane protein YoaK (UPF0700 family)
VDDGEGELTEAIPGRTASRDVMLLVLTCAAGLVDAISYLEMGHVFTAMMTGNTVLLALAIGQGELVAALRSTLALGAFSVGAAGGAMVLLRGHARGKWPPIVTATLALEAVVLGVFGVVWHVNWAAPRAHAVTLVLIGLSGLAMGIQAAAVRHLGVPGVASTYITGTLTSLMAELVTWLRPRDASSSGEPANRWPIGSASRHLPLLASVFLVYGAGALIGTVLQARSSSLLAWLPCVCLTGVVVNGLVRHREPRLKHS